MRKISAKKIQAAIEALSIDANIELEQGMRKALHDSLKKEKSGAGRDILSCLVKNFETASKERIPVCQDTGFAIVFLEIGQDVHIVDGDLNLAVQNGVRSGYKKGYLRKSIVSDPFMRKNSGDNAPAVLHTEIVPGDRIRITFMAKGGGSENVSAAKVLKPSEGIEGAEKFVLKTVEDAGGNPCPPIIVGVGIGGTLDKAALIAKKALFRDVGKHNKDRNIAALEKNLLNEINKLGIGPGGLGGKVTALAVNIETFPCHIASLPVAVNVDCHAHRVKKAVI